MLINLLLHLIRIIILILLIHINHLLISIVPADFESESSLYIEPVLKGLTQHNLLALHLNSIVK